MRSNKNDDLNDDEETKETKPINFNVQLIVY